MATQHILIDDMDGTRDDVRAITFALNGTTYALDLGADNRDALAAALEPFIARARPERPTRVAAAKNGGQPLEDIAALRHWARANGFEIGDRGRIPQTVRDAYASR